MSYYLNKEVAIYACALIRPAIDELFRSPYPKRKCLHLVVLDPTKQHESTSDVDSILFEESINGAEWGEYAFNDFARAKAFLSFRTGLSSLEVQQFRPHLYEEGDVKYGGSVIFNGIIAAASGIQPYFDAMCAMWLATACHAIATHDFQSLLASDNDWVHK